MTAPRLPHWFGLCLLCCIAWGRPTHAAERTAFYYGHSIPPDLLAAYDQIVVEPDHLSDLRAFTEHTARPVAYLSVGEVARASKRAKDVSKRWVLAENPAWSSLVMDLDNQQYQAYLLSRFEQLWSLGYRGFFLDTLDSYRLAKPDDGGERARQALVKIIHTLRQRHPEARLLLNRGFEILADVKAAVSGVVAESLFDRWDAGTQRYRRVPPDDRSWLVAQLQRARDEYGLPVTVIDYRPPTERAEARATARKIQALGFEPWVTDAALESVGIGSLEILPRRVLILTNDAPSPTQATAREPDAMRYLAPVLEYLGYVPEHRRVPADLAELGLERGYQGVITWFSSGSLPAGYADWMSAQMRRGIRFAVFGVPGFDLAGPQARALGIALVAPAGAGAAEVTEQDGLVGFEAQPARRPFDGPLVNLTPSRATRVHLRLKDGAGQSGVAIATTPWGGLALSHVFALRGLAGERAWVLDPFGFLHSALALPDAPMPNLTTLNGRRLAMILVRPEGLGALAGYGQPRVASALGQWLSAQHRWPHSLAALPSDPATVINSDDRAAAEGLLQLSFFERAELSPGTTSARGKGASLTQVGGMFMGAELVGPIALDSLFLPSGGPQAYPYRDVLGTLAYTEAPRRLKPVLVDYHGYILATPGGRSAIDAIYAWLDAEQLHPLYVSEYAALAQAFTEQVVARELGGAFRYFGGERLLTVRSPLALGLPRPNGSAVSVRRAADGYYVSFMPRRARTLLCGGERLDAPHLIHTNAGVLGFDVKTHDAESTTLSLELRGHVPLSLELGGLPVGTPCQLVFEGGRARGVTSASGALALDLEQTATGVATLECHAAKENG